MLKLPLDDSRATAKALGGSINDFFVTGAAGGAGAYHRAKGVDVSALRISMPVSNRSTTSVGGNNFTPARVVVPTDARPASPVRRDQPPAPRRPATNEPSASPS